MQITAGTLNLSATTAQTTRVERTQHLEMWIGQRPRPASGGPGVRADQFQPGRFGPVADNGLGRMLEQAAKVRQQRDAGETDDGLSPELRKILTLLEKVFGMKGARQAIQRMQVAEKDHATAQQAAAQPAAPAPVGWGLIAETHQRTVEMQSATLTAQAELTLADGSTRSFALSWSQTSIRIEESSTRLALGDAKLSDPLVLDLDGNGVTFGAQRATVDLNRDGKAESIATPTGADALLVWDRNGDGKVQDGSEVVGAASGQAFNELAALDGDRNGWIDSADAAFSHLKLWNGHGLKTLATSGVAAIATSSVALPYAHRDAAGDLQAVGRRGGVFVKEDGTPGAALQVDLVT